MHMSIKILWIKGIYPSQRNYWNQLSHTCLFHIKQEYTEKFIREKINIKQNPKSKDLKRW